MRVSTLADLGATPRVIFPLAFIIIKTTQSPLLLVWVWVFSIPRDSGTIRWVAAWQHGRGGRALQQHRWDRLPRGPQNQQTQTQTQSVGWRTTAASTAAAWNRSPRGMVAALEHGETVAALSAIPFIPEARPTTVLPNSNLLPNPDIPQPLPPPLYITIGPPCAGKTSWIHHQNVKDEDDDVDDDVACTSSISRRSRMMIVDVNMDDQPGVYRPIPTQWFLSSMAAPESGVVPGADSSSSTTTVPNIDTNINNTNNNNTDNNISLYDVVCGKSILERIQSADQAELRSVLARLTGMVTADAFATMPFLVPDTSHKNRFAAAAPTDFLQAALVQCVEELMSSTTTMTKPSVESEAVARSTNDDDDDDHTFTPYQQRPWTIPPRIDLYIREALFQSQNTNNNNTTDATKSNNNIFIVNQKRNHSGNNNKKKLLSAIERSIQQLWEHSTSTINTATIPGSTPHTPVSSPPFLNAVAWGNTNTHATDYRAALTVAAATGRPVHFIVYADMEMLPMRRSTDDTNELSGGSTSVKMGRLFDLSTDNGFFDLVRRNLQRFLATGRYVPVPVIWHMRERTQRLIQRGLDEALALKQRKEQQKQESGPTQLFQDHADSVSPLTSVDGSTDLNAHGPPPEELWKNLSKQEFHQGLARLIHFEMAPNRTVVLPATATTVSKQPLPTQRQEHLYERHNNNSRRNIKADFSAKRPRSSSTDRLTYIARIAQQRPDMKNSSANYRDSQSRNNDLFHSNRQQQIQSNFAGYNRGRPESSIPPYRQLLPISNLTTINNHPPNHYQMPHQQRQRAWDRRQHRGKDPVPGPPPQRHNAGIHRREQNQSRRQNQQRQHPWDRQNRPNRLLGPLPRHHGDDDILP